MPLLQLVSYMFINISGQLSLLLNNYVLVNSSRLFNLFFQFVIFVPLSSPVINFKASGKKRVWCMFSGLWFNFSFFLYPILHMFFGSWDPFEGQDERPCTINLHIFSQSTIWQTNSSSISLFPCLSFCEIDCLSTTNVTWLKKKFISLDSLGESFFFFFWYNLLQ